MSMNLSCSEVELWQTPTHITHMCLMEASGTVAFEVKGKRAVRALYMYMEWVRSHCDGVWSDEQLYKQRVESVNKHIAQVLNILDLPNLEVWQS